MAATPLPVHIPTADEADAHLVEKANADGTCIVRDATTGQLTTVRLGLYSITGNVGRSSLSAPAPAEPGRG